MKKIILFLLSVPVCLFSQENDIAFKTFTVNRDFCRGYQTTSGSFIFIPDNAFTLEDGSICGQSIVIKYREFHSQTDMFYSGINMLWDDNGRYRILESVGMFEIQAWCGDKKLVLRPEKEVQVRMKTRRDLKGLMSFVYNQAKNTWSRYESKVMDFSFREKASKSDSVDYWGSGRQAVDGGSAVIDGDGMEVFIQDIARKMPEGFFKGMNIKQMGIFNYDGVIKDSLAVPMVPEIYVRNESTIYNQKIYVTYPNRNTLVYYYPDDLKTNFVLLDVKGIRIFTEFSDGNVGVTRDEEIEKMVISGLRGKTVKFILDKTPARASSKKDLTAKTGINAL